MPDDDYPFRLGVAHTRGTAVYSYLIRLVTWSNWNHSLIYFDNVPPDLEPSIPQGTRVYFESLWKKDRRQGGTGKTGVRGPVPWFDLIDYIEGNKRRRLVCQDLPYGEDLVRLAYVAAKAMVGNVRYAPVQLFSNLKAAVGLGTPIWAKSPKAKTCSEFAAVIWDGCDPGVPFISGPCRRILQIGTRRVFDDITPAGRNGLKPAIDKFLAFERDWSESP